MMKVVWFVLLAGSSFTLSAAARAQTGPTGFASGGGADEPVRRWSHAEPASSTAGHRVADDVRAMVAEMLAEARSRHSLLAAGDGPAGCTGGHDGRFFVASADNRFRLNFSGQIQLRYYAVFRDSGSAPTGVAGNDNALEGGFQMRRARLRLSGHAVDPDLTYVVMGEFTDVSGGGNMILRDALVAYKLGDGWAVKVGQFKPPFVREEYMDDAKRLAVETSQATAAFVQGRSQGVELGYSRPDHRVLLLLFDGLNTANTDFATAAGAPSAAESDYAFTGRVDWSPVGKVSDFDEFSSGHDSPWVFNLGCALLVQGSSNTRDTGGGGGQADTTLLGYTADAMLKGAGWNFYAQFMGMSAHRPNVPPQIAAASTDDYGLMTQAGYRFLKHDEAFIRYDATFYDSDRGFVDDRQDFLTLGLIHYFAGHAAKLTADVVVALQPTTNAAGAILVPTLFSGASTVTTGGGGLRSTDAGAAAVRVQMQVLF